MSEICTYNKGTACQNPATHYCIAEYPFDHWELTDQVRQVERLDGYKMFRERQGANGKNVLDADGRTIMDPAMHTVEFCEACGTLECEARNAENVRV